MVIDKIINVLDTFDYPYRRQGTYLSDEPYPPTFFTYWNIRSPFSDYGDNIAHTTIYEYMIYVYSRNESLVYSITDELINKFEKLDFVVTNKGEDISCDDKSFVGRVIRIIYKENMEE